MTQVILIDSPLSYLTPEQQTAWETWLTQHHLDPMRIPVPDTIVIDNQHRTIATTYYRFDTPTRLHLDSMRRPIFEPAIRQLESPALPHPTGYDTAETTP